MVKKYQSAISALALHPTGLFVAVGFSDQLHLMEILLDTLKTVKSFDFPRCDELVFSHQGHLLACAYQSLITIFSVFSFDVLGTLKVRNFLFVLINSEYHWKLHDECSLQGHNGKILGMSWSIDDTILVSSGSEGAIYEWSVTKMFRVSESVEKGTEFRSIALTRDHSIYVCTNTGIFRELHDTEIVREIVPNSGNPLTQIALARSNLMLFIGTEKGTLYNLQVPFLEAGGGTCTKYRYFGE